MSRLFIVQSLLLILVFGLMGCGTNNNKENVSNEPGINNESNQVDDFKVTINVETGEKDLNVYATIIYMGEEAQKDIYHGGSIFMFNVYQQDGDFEYLGAMNLPLLTTTLIRNEPHRVNFEGIEKLKLKPGTFEFEAIANFSLDSNNVIESKIEIPVYKIVAID
ncbi:hypothetical protein [Paenisporosarcina quisquiliarum]|uniref:hypothetical protein n=1 Tax=Paenisporosarcina quisquiliarum TaxID=365346 RepID=UPI0037365786